MANLKNNLFEMGTDFSDDWQSDNKNRVQQKSSNTCKEVLTPQKHQLHFAKEKRRGKVVTIVKPFCLDKKELQALLKTIKKKLGTGGTLKENTLEFQGELQKQLREMLESLNYRFKK
jgi:translation initiation factor 1